MNNKNLIAEVISIGDEMTSGARLDTNAQWLSRRLEELGVEVAFHSTVGDTLADNVDVFRIATERANVVVSTGGLGPTRDDLTREALAQMADVQLELRESALNHIRNMFQSRNREMPERNQVQAMFPAGSEEIFNPQGTAPGVDMTVQPPRETPHSRTPPESSRIFALPGVPAEMKRMFDETVAPRVLGANGAERKIRHSVMKFFGTGESDMERRLGDMIARDRQPRVGITVSAATISLRITAMAESDERCDVMINQTRNEILQRAGEFYFGDGEHFEQYHAIDALLRSRNENMMVVEFGYAAPVGDWFASLGETPSYRGGLSLASPDDLLRLIDGDENSVMVRLKTLFQVDWLLAIDSYPTLDPLANVPTPPAEVRLLVVSPAGQRSIETISLGGHPDILHARIGKAAMAWQRKILNNHL